MAFLGWKEIREDKFDIKQYLKTGTKLDKYIIGFGLSHLVIITGLRASGKTSFVGNIICEMIHNGIKGLLCSFEMKCSRTKNWIRRQFLGKDNLKEVKLESGNIIYEPKNDTIMNIADDIIDKYLYTYDNKSFKLDEVSRQIKEKLNEDKSIKYLVLDNLMKLDNEVLSEDEYKAQALLVKRFQVFAQQNNITIILVAHPSKTKGLIRLCDIKGSGTIADASDTVIITHRNNDDFRIAAKEYFGWKVGSKELQFNNILEIAKDREFGNDGIFCGMYFEPKAKRMLNEIDENKDFLKPRQQKIEEIK